MTQVHPGPDRAGRLASGERSLHTGEVVGSIPTAPTSCIAEPPYEIPLAYFERHCLAHDCAH